VKHHVRNFAAAMVATVFVALVGCASFSRGVAPISNPIFVNADHSDNTWERTVDVVHDYLFEIERENKLGGVIETRYKTGANLFEPWHRDSIGIRNRSESTIQSIRRKAFLSITPVEGGYMVGVEAHKELEDVARVAKTTDAATFRDSSPLSWDSSPAVELATPSGWISKGRDELLEQSMLHSISRAFRQ
jgi:hypothetical protein